MPRLRPDQLPAHRKHASGLGVVTLSGHDWYTGPYGTPESRKKYEQLTARWLANGRRPIRTDPAGSPTVADLCGRYLRFAEVYYRKDDRPTSYFRWIKHVLSILDKLDGSTPLNAFDRNSVRVFRDYLLNTPGRYGGRAGTVRGPRSRQTVNNAVGVLRAAFRWGAEEGMVSTNTLTEVSIPRNLPKGRTTAADRPPVGPAPQESIDALIAHARKPIPDMIRVQLLTGMRPVEVCGIRGQYIDRSGAVWSYRVPDRLNKEAHQNRERIVPVGPKAQAILGPYLSRSRPAEPVFRSRDGAAQNPTTYGLAIRRWCRKLGVPTFSPNRLRHAAATRIRAAHGIEVARSILGHSDISTTQIYAKVDLEMAKAAAMADG